MCAPPRACRSAWTPTSTRCPRPPMRMAWPRAKRWCAPSTSPRRATCSGMAFVRARRFEDARDQDATEFGALGRYDGWIGSQDRIIAGFSAEHGIESRNDIETPTTVALESLRRPARGSFAHTHLFNRFSLETRLDARRLQYDSASQEYRDRCAVPRRAARRLSTALRSVLGGHGLFQSRRIRRSDADHALGRKPPAACWGCTST